jgi:hypothetical protein
MRELTGYKLLDWVFKDYTYVGDLIEFEGPVLVHYMNHAHHALYYWVEGNDKYNRWLCFEVTINELYRYLHNAVSLFELIEKKKQETFYTVDIDRNLKYSNYQMVLGYLIPKEYKPAPDSYYNDELSDVYDKLFRQFLDKGIYHERLMENSFDLVIEASDSNKYDGTVSLRQCKEFLFGIDASYRNFNSYHAYNTLKQTTSDVNKINRLIGLLQSASDLRVPSVYANSFHISLAPDIIMKNTGDKVFNTLRKELPTKFKDEVLNVDLNDDTVIANIVQSYEPSARKGIFEPLIKVINNPNFTLKYIDKQRNNSKIYEKVSQENKKKIAPKIEETQPESDLTKLMFYTFTVEMPENADISTISKKELKEGTLFAKISDEATQELQKFETDKYIIVFKEPISIIHKHDERTGEYKMLFDPLGISVKDAARNNAGTKFIDEMERIVNEDYLAKVPKNKNNKKFFDDYVQSFDYKSS